MRPLSTVIFETERLYARDFVKEDAQDVFVGMCATNGGFYFIWD